MRDALARIRKAITVGVFEATKTVVGITLTDIDWRLWVGAAVAETLAVYFVPNRELEADNASDV